MFNINRRKLRANLHDFGEAVNVITTGRWIFYCIVLGVFAGLSALLFSYLLNLIQEITITNMAGIVLPQPEGESKMLLKTIPAHFFDAFSFQYNWLILVLPAAGGLISGFIVFRYAPEAEGHGTDAVIRAFHHNKGIIRPVVPFVKLIASSFTIGTGGSAGKEGPIAQVAAGVGSFMAAKLNMSARERKTLLMAGMGAGIGAIFKAPIGGALFASEVFFRKDFESEGLVASIIASIIAYSVYASVDGWDPIFLFQPVSFTNPAELPFFILLALVVMVIGVLYTKTFYGTKTLFEKLEIPRYAKPALGGLLLGVIAFFFPAVIGSSYGYLQMALNGNLPILFMALLVILKIIATSLTIQSGGSGGVFAPSLVIGGLVGGIFGYGMEALAPGLISSPEAFVLVGMASFFAGVANVPVSATIMISEMSESYGLVVPLIFASAIAYLGTQGWSLYKEQLSEHRSSASYRDELMYDLLRKVKVRSAYQKMDRMPILNHRNSVSEILGSFSRSDAVVLPVENGEHEIIGLVSLYSLRELIQQDVGDVIIAADIMHPPRMLYLNDSLSKAFRYFVESEEPEIPVLQPGGRECIGVLSERDFLLAYERTMTEKKT